MHHLDNFWSGFTTYSLSVLGMLGGKVSAEAIVFWLGLLLLAVRLAYESIRLYRYWRTGEGGNG